jgi:hypothetical protein
MHAKKIYLSKCTRTLSAVLRIPDPIFSIPDPGLTIFLIPDPDKRIQVFLTQKTVISSQNYDPGCSSQILDLDFFPSPIKILDPRVKKNRIPDPDPQHCLSEIKKI